MPPLMDQIDQAVNLARLQAQQFRNRAAATDDQKEAARFIGRAEALCDLATEACSFNIRTAAARRQALTLLLLLIDTMARALDESQTQERPLQIAN